MSSDILPTTNNILVVKSKFGAAIDNPGGCIPYQNGPPLAKPHCVASGCLETTPAPFLVPVCVILFSVLLYTFCDPSLNISYFTFHTLSPYEPCRPSSLTLQISTYSLKCSQRLPTTLSLLTSLCSDRSSQIQPLLSLQWSQTA